MEIEKEKQVLKILHAHTQLSYTHEKKYEQNATSSSLPLHKVEQVSQTITR